jgi:coenzyme PQQ precursor peptide PqqA
MAAYRIAAARALACDGKLRYHFHELRIGVPCAMLRLQKSKMLQRDQCEVTIMAWTTPTLIEICIGLEINGYLPAEF